MPDVTPRTLNDSLRRLHRSALVSLALCALGIGAMILAHGAPPIDAAERTWSLVALALAALAILTRRSSLAPRRSLRAFVYGSVVSMLGAVGLGLLGLFVALRESQTTVGLLYTMAGLLLLLRPPATLELEADGEREQRTGS